MKRTKVILFSVLSLFLLSISNDAMAVNDKKNKRKKNATEEKVDTSEMKAKKTYEELIKGAKTTNGMLITHFTPNDKLYFELNSSIEDRVFLLSNRVSSTSDTRDLVAGQMVLDPFMVRFVVDSNRVVMHRVLSGSDVDKNDVIKISFERNFKDPILKTFKPVATNENNVVIDITDFYRKDEKSISPILKSDSPNYKPISGKFSDADSYITGVKTFPENIEVKSTLNFITDSGIDYTVGVHRSLVLLPKEPMQRRIQDNRVGYFSSKFDKFSSSFDVVKTVDYIHRWRLEPREEDMQKYLAGELVTPKKPIIFYVDNAFPEKWRGTIIQGINDWNIAFEAAGFKNAIEGREYPTKEENPDFDPDDIRYSCFKYATTDIANAMGPSFVDPRSGEIIVADVIWYHGVISLVHNWKFVQTAAVDSRVRKFVFDDDVMRESLRYVASHEVGHTVGLMHNMGASYSFPVDSLRSPSFTQLYGTTPSIMDYARNNYIAQPGDFEKGVRMTPPIMGIYDIHAINWGYRVFADSTPENTKKELLKIISDKSNNDMYRFGAAQIGAIIDPTDLTEDLGDNHIKASDYCIKNLKIVLNNLESWHVENGESFNELVDLYREALVQYNRVVFHVAEEVGGVELREVMQGEPASQKAARYLSKADQKKAMLWMVNQARTCLDWVTPQYVIDRFPVSNILPSINDNMPAAFVSRLFQPGVIGRIYASSKLGDENSYTVESYYTDLLDAIFSQTLKNKNLSASDMQIEATALDQLFKLSGLAKTANKSDKSLADIGDAALAVYTNEISKSSLACSHAMHNHKLADNTDSANSFTRYIRSQATAPDVLTHSIAYAKINWIKDLYKTKRAKANSETKSFYDYQLLKIERFIAVK